MGKQVIKISNRLFEIKNISTPRIRPTWSNVFGISDKCIVEFEYPLFFINRGLAFCIIQKIKFDSKHDGQLFFHDLLKCITDPEIDFE